MLLVNIALQGMFCNKFYVGMAGTLPSANDAVTRSPHHVTKRRAANDYRPDDRAANDDRPNYRAANDDRPDDQAVRQFSIIALSFRLCPVI